MAGAAESPYSSAAGTKEQVTMFQRTPSISPRGRGEIQSRVLKKPSIVNDVVTVYAVKKCVPDTLVHVNTPRGNGEPSWPSCFRIVSCFLSVPDRCCSCDFATTNMNSLKGHMRRHPQEHQAMRLLEQYR